jgi:cardiolipin synthase
MTVLGSFLDPIADKLLLVSAYVVLTVPGLHPGLEIPIWVTILVIARDVLIVVLALILFLALGITRFPPRALSKVNTAVQIAAVILVLLTGVMPGLERVALPAVYLVAGLTVLSGLDYIVQANHLAAVKSREAT